MKELNLTVQKRDAVGKGPNRRLRGGGDVPAIVYGPGMDPITVKVNYLNLYHLMHGVPLNTLISLDIEGLEGPARKVLIRELQKDPVSGHLMHIDFHQIPLDKPIALTIPIRTVGTPIGVATFGGISEMIRRSIDISCLPTDIPEEVVVDISHLSIGDSLHVSDLKLEKLEVLTSPEQTIVTVVAPTITKEAAPAKTAEEEAAAEAAEGEGEEGAKAEGEGEEKEEEEKEKGKEKGKDKERGKGKGKEGKE